MHYTGNGPTRQPACQPAIHRTSVVLAAPHRCCWCHVVVVMSFLLFLFGVFFFAGIGFFLLLLLSCLTTLKPLFIFLPIFFLQSALAALNNSRPTVGGNSKNVRKKAAMLHKTSVSARWYLEGVVSFGHNLAIHEIISIFAIFIMDILLVPSYKYD